MMDADRTDSEATNPRLGWHHGLLVVPFIWQLALAPFTNDASWQVAGLPFQMVWQMAGVFVASICIGIVFRIDHAGNADGEGAE